MSYKSRSVLREYNENIGIREGVVGVGEKLGTFGDYKRSKHMKNSKFLLG